MFVLFDHVSLARSEYRQVRRGKVPTLCLVHAASMSYNIRTADPAPPNELPGLTLNFPHRLAEAISRRLLQPHARPENFLVGIQPRDLGFELSAYAVVPTSWPVGLPLDSLVVRTRELARDSACVYVVGTTIDVKSLELSDFLDRTDRLGRFYLGCGCHPVVVPGLIDNWRIVLESIQTGDMNEVLQLAIERAGLSDN